MQESIDVPAPAPKRGVFAKLGVGLQWLAFALVALLAIGMFVPSDRLTAPNAPVTLHWIAAGAVVILAVAMFPPVFLRFGQRWRKWPYLALLPCLIFMAFAAGRVEQAWLATPQGREEARLDAQRKEAAAIATARQEADERRRASAAATVDLARRRYAALRDCLTAGEPRLPALEDAVKEGLHNPDRFEHVSTEIVGPLPSGDNARMVFRAENGFSALRIWMVDAKIDPDSCTVVSTGNVVGG